MSGNLEQCDGAGATDATPLPTTQRLVLGAPHLGYRIGEPRRGRGYATEAARKIVDFAFEVTNLETMTCACRVTNPASRRVIEKCGFQRRGKMMIDSPGAGGRVAARRYVLDRGAWARLKSGAALEEGGYGIA